MAITRHPFEAMARVRPDMASLLSLIPGCFAVRVHGRRWLKITKPAIRPAIGWRALSWTPELADAEKWTTRDGAERFAAPLQCPFEIVDVEKQSGMSPAIA